jgi:ketosteroid isomerase-like protein
MLNRVVLEREKRYCDIVLEFVSDTDRDWPDLVEVSADRDQTRVRLRVHSAELETLAVALDSAYTGGDGVLYFRGPES